MTGFNKIEIISFSQNSLNISSSGLTWQLQGDGDQDPSSGSATLNNTPVFYSVRRERGERQHAFFLRALPESCICYFPQIPLATAGHMATDEQKSLGNADFS